MLFADTLHKHVVAVKQASRHTIMSHNPGSCGVLQPVTRKDSLLLQAHHLEVWSKTLPERVMHTSSMHSLTAAHHLDHHSLKP
jgi:hypothetical protein